MTTLYIQTPYGKKYTVSEDGRINGSDKWLMLGIRHTKRTSHFIPLAQLFTPGAIDELTWCYKTSNNPCWTVQDWDHGTVRIWGNTKAHGIKYIWLEEREACNV